jgi:WD40 repeat protein
VLCLNVEEGTGSDGQGMMICGSSDFNISVWELHGALYPNKMPGGVAQPTKVATLTGHRGGVLDVAWNKDRIVSW